MIPKCDKLHHELAIGGSDAFYLCAKLWLLTAGNRWEGHPGWPPPTLVRGSGNVPMFAPALS